MANTYTLINSQILTASAASVTLSNIPSIYTDLVLKMSARTDRAAYVDTVAVRFNASSGATNTYINMYGDSTGAVSTTLGNSTSNIIGYASGTSTTSNIFASSDAYINNYTSTTLNKSYEMSYAIENNSSTQSQAFVGCLAGLWADTSAITSIVLTPGYGTNFISGTYFQLYGIKNS